MIRIRLILTVLGLSFVTSLVLARPAAADNCDIFINPADCQNTGWTIGTIATLAGGVAVAMAATAARGSKGGGKGGSVERREPPAPPPAGFWIPNRTQRERRETAEDVDIRPTSDPLSVTIRPPDGVVRSHSVTLKAHSDPGWQTVQEVDHGHD